MLTVMVILSVLALLVTIMSPSTWPWAPPLWIAVLLLSIIALLQAVPLGR
jgi:hypothetical protein